MIPYLFRQRSVAFALGCWAFVLIGWTGLIVPSLAREVEDGFVQTDVGLGLFYFVTAVAYAAGSVLGGMATERVGRRVILSGAASLLGIGLIAQGVTPDWTAFLAFGVVRSVGAGAIDGGGNGLVIDLYTGARGGRLNLLHLFFSLGALGAPFALAARGLLGLSWGTVVVASGVAALPLAAAFAVTDLADGRARPQLAAGGRRSSLLALPLLVLGVAIGCYVACEVGVSNWLVRFLAAAPAATATSALGLYWAGLAAGRLVGSRVADRFDHVRLAIAAALACAVALLFAVVVPSLEASIALFTLVGFASGPIYPLIVAVGGERFPDRAAAVAGLIVAASVVGGRGVPPAPGGRGGRVPLPAADGRDVRDRGAAGGNGRDGGGGDGVRGSAGDRGTDAGAEPVAGASLSRMTSGDWQPNPRDRAWSCQPADPGAAAFHRSLDGYAPTPLVDLPDLAPRLRVGRVLAKDESSRLGLPAFKALGASWAVHRVLQSRPGGDSPVTFVTATDGNHGRAVARMARLEGHRARVFVPDGVSAQAIDAIEGERAQVVHVDGSYDDAVAAAAAFGEAESAVLLQDMAWPGYETIPGWIVEGYATLFAEADVQMAELGIDSPDLLVVPAGVGSLAQAALTHYRSRVDPARTAVMTVEPVVAACVLASLRAGERVSVPTSVTSMAGLNCGTASSSAWPVLRAGLDAAVSVDDEAAAAAGRLLRAGGVNAGPCGWAALAGATCALTGDGATERRAMLRVGRDATVLLVVTEGAEANPG